LGRSRGGLTTKIHMLTDALGRPVRFILTPGQVGDVTQAPALLAGETAEHVIADRACDSKALREVIEAMGAEAVIPVSPTRKHPATDDAINTGCATASSAALTNSSTSAGPPPASIVEPRTSSPSSISPVQ
jgi:transposase